VALRRRAWQRRQVALEPERWPLVPDGRPSPDLRAETLELLRAVEEGIVSDLTHHQREAFTALALNRVAIDVLAERLGTTRRPLYETLHEARRKLPARIARSGLDLGAVGERA
jgi:DNA-directed RNA polymerase specialized sigma24 family protein